MPISTLIIHDVKDGDEAQRLANEIHQVDTRIECSIRLLAGPVSGPAHDDAKAALAAEIQKHAVLVVLVGDNTNRNAWVDSAIAVAAKHRVGIMGVCLEGLDESFAPAGLMEVAIQPIQWEAKRIVEDILDVAKTGADPRTSKDPRVNPRK
jgi:hypothetical protein